MTTLFANVNPTSRYASQAQAAPVEVSFVPDYCGYHWKGGIGGQYTTPDLLFFTKTENGFEPLEMCDLGSHPQLKNTLATIANGKDQNWHSSYWAGVLEIAKDITAIAEQAHKEALIKEDEEEDCDW